MVEQSSYLIATALSAGIMAGLWLVMLRTGNAGIVDIGWTFTVGVLAVFAALVQDGWWVRRSVVAIVMAMWSARLGFYLLRDRVIGRPEDGRYAELRRTWGDRANQRFFWFFEAQAAAALFFAVPAFLASSVTTPELSWLELAALLLWTAGFAGEALADFQLAAFKRTAPRRGMTCQVGLWHYSRHPNYFFEWVMWVAYALLALAAPWGFLALACPMVLLYLLFRVTGIPATEAQALRTRGAEYRRYQETTSAFIPWRPRR